MFGTVLISYSESMTIAVWSGELLYLPAYKLASVVLCVLFGRIALFFVFSSFFVFIF